VGQIVGCLHNKHEALSSNPSTAKKKREREKRRAKSVSTLRSYKENKNNRIIRKALPGPRFT
jgi:hypothetical protein